MSTVNLLPFLRGLDISGSNFKDADFPNNIGEMNGLHWFKAESAGLKCIPDQLSSLNKLELLTISKNEITTIPHWIGNNQNLRNIVIKQNKLKCSSFTPEMFLLKDLSVLDLKGNDIERIPAQMIQAQGLQVLNLANNKISKLPNHLFTNLIDLLYLDLSGNQIETLPPQLRRMTNLQTLILDQNPLQNFQFRQLPWMTGLRTLKMRDTGRTIQNIPTNLDHLANLDELDLSDNNLTWIPEQIFKLKGLKRLNLSGNSITLIPSKIELLQKLEVLNLCSNSIKNLPSTLCKLSNLRRLYLDDNQLETNGIPTSIGRLKKLQVLSLADNILETLPSSICDCTNLKTLILTNNILTTLPSQLYRSKELKKLETRNNPNLKMLTKDDLELAPSKLEAELLGASPSLCKGNLDVIDEYYNINFSLKHHLHKAGILDSHSNNPLLESDTLMKKSLDYKNMGGDSGTLSKSIRVEGENERKVLQGMSDVATGYNSRHRQPSVDVEYSREPTAVRSPNTSFNLAALHNIPSGLNTEIEKNNNLDYGDFFDHSVGMVPGITCWEIENFLPNRLDDALIGKFYDGDCYIVLKTYYSKNEFESSNSPLSWKIFYWIGKNATLDKQACAAMHAVNLRNFLRGSTCRTCREEQGDESPEFMEVFGYNLKYIEGGRTATGFYSVLPKEHITRLYRCSCKGNAIVVEPVPLTPLSLNTEYSYLLDAPKSFYIWQGANCKSVISSKTRLLAEKMNNVERKKECSLVHIREGKETATFMELLNENVDSHNQIVPLNKSDAKSHHILYKVGLGTGYLELSQIKIPLRGRNLNKALLDSKAVYILDSYSCDVFVWVGRKANRLVRTAAFKLAKEVVYDFIPRPKYGEIIHLFEGTESLMFKCKFSGWNDVLAVDHTRSAQSILKKGIDHEKIIENIKMDIDLSALFKVRQPPLDPVRAKAAMDDWNEDLEAMECFVLEGKKYVKLPENEIGQFYSATCYAFICRYWVAVEVKNQAVITIKAAKNNNGYNDDVDSVQNKRQDNARDDRLWEEKFQPVIYFWQGRDASDIGWLTFSFGLAKKFEQTFGKENLQVVRVLQQQESPKFLSHFKRRFLIHSGPRPSILGKDINNAQQPVPALYQLRTNNSMLFYTRCIQLLKCDATCLCSSFCYILKMPSAADSSTTNYVWAGKQAPEDESELCEELAYKISKDNDVSVVQEGEEPDAFWTALGGKKIYDQHAEYMKHLRLFRCSNDQGFFRITERCGDFCQDDLCDEDIMILDDGSKVFLWVGPQSSEIEMKLASKSAMLYLEHQSIINPGLPRKLLFAMKGNESMQFKRSFHAWNHYKQKLN